MEKYFVFFCFTINIRIKSIKHILNALPPPTTLHTRFLHYGECFIQLFCSQKILKVILQLQHSGKIFCLFFLTINIRIKPFKYILNALPPPTTLHTRFLHYGECFIQLFCSQKILKVILQLQHSGKIFCLFLFHNKHSYKTV